MPSEQVVLVHGAWHHASCWDRVVGELHQMGISATAVDLPLTGFANDVTRAREAIEVAGPDAIVVGHSYGGAVISAAAKDGSARQMEEWPSDHSPFITRPKPLADLLAVHIR